MTHSCSGNDEAVPLAEVTGLAGGRGQSQLLVKHLQKEGGKGGRSEGIGYRERKSSEWKKSRTTRAGQYTCTCTYL